MHLVNLLLSIILISEDISQFNSGQFHSQQTSWVLMSEFLLSDSAVAVGNTPRSKGSPNDPLRSGCKACRHRSATLAQTQLVPTPLYKLYFKSLQYSQTVPNVLATQISKNTFSESSEHYFQSLPNS